MELTADQKSQVSTWLAEGANLSEIQRKLAGEFGVGITYMETRFLIDDLKLQFKEPEPEPVSEPVPEVVALEAQVDEVESAGTQPVPLEESFGAAPGAVSLRVDAITRPGAMVSGTVTFSDGENAAWYLDQSGRLGMVPGQPGYRPPEPDIAQFQMALESELAKLGY
jgi:hypothetical protein